MTKRRALAALSLSALSLLAACGGGSGSGGAKVEASADDKSSPAVSLQDLVSASVTKAAATSTSRFSMQMAMPGPDGQAMDVVATGKLDNASGAMSMTMDMAGMVPGMDGKIEAVFDGHTIYYKFPSGLGFPSAKPWVKMDFDDLSKMSGIDLDGMMKQFDQSDPMANLGMLAGASDVTEVGREQVRGVDTRHLKMTVSLQDAVASAPESVRESVAKMVALLGTGSYPAEVWIGDDDLPYRMKMDIPMPGGAPASGPMGITMEFFDYGVDVDLEIPPADQTMDFMELIGSMAGAGMGS